MSENQSLSIREFDILGEKRHDHTYRTAIIQHLTGIEGKTFVDLGCADGYETYSVAAHGAKSALGLEGRAEMVAQGKHAAELLGVSDRAEFRVQDVRRVDEIGLPKFDVVMNFGLLYHLQNSFNHLKRVRNICGGDLLLETQIAPLDFDGVERVEVQHLSDLTTITLDGVPFTGRANEYVTRTGSRGIGSIDRSLVTWLTVESIEKALDLAGFEVLLTVHGNPPEALEPWSTMLGHNKKRLKALFHARVRQPEQHIPVQKGTVKGLFAAPVSYPTLSGLRRTRRRIFHVLKWHWREYLPGMSE